jgi:hypothetical protein
MTNFSAIYPEKCSHLLPENVSVYSSFRFVRSQHTHTHTHTPYFNIILRAWDYTKNIFFYQTSFSSIFHFYMRKIILCLAVCVAAGAGAFAQVGILTENPQGMFHVDPKGDTQGSLNTGDDVIVTTEGNVGIGILPEPTTPHSLTLTGGGTPAAPRSPLRIEDGNQQEGRVLTGNANGYATWQDLPAGFNPGRVYGLQGIPATSVSTTVTVFTFTADIAGLYTFEIRWWGRLIRQVTVPFVIFNLYKGSSLVDTFEQYGGLNSTDIGTFSLCLTFYADAAAGDSFTLRVTPSGTSLPGGQTTQVSPDWTQAKVNVLRIN